MEIRDDDAGRSPHGAVRAIEPSVEQSNRLSLERIESLIAIALTLALVALHVNLLCNAGPLWRDEICSLATATKPSWAAFRAALILDPCPVFLFALLRVWHSIFGGKDFALRILGFLIGLSCIGAIWISARLTTHRTPTLALLLLGFCSTQIVWGDTLRGYGLGVLFTVMTFALFWCVIERPRPSNIALATIAATLSVQSLYSTALLVFACGISAAIVAIRRGQAARSLIVVAIGVVAALSLLPYVSIMHQTTEWASLLRVNFSLRSSFGMLARGLYGGGSMFFWAWAALAVVAVIAAVVVQKKSSEHRADYPPCDLTLYALISGVLGFIATMAFFRAVGWGTNIWYYLPMLAVAALAIDAALNFRGVISGARAAIALIVVLSCSPILFARSEMRASNLDLVAHVVERKAAPDDLVIVYPWVDAATFKRYFHGKTPWFSLPVIPEGGIETPEEYLAVFRRPDGIQPLIDQVDRTLKAGHSVWLSSSWPEKIPEQPPRNVLPLGTTERQPIGYYFHGWGQLLLYHLRSHTDRVSQVDVPCDQPISAYEHSHLISCSGWREPAPQAP